MIGTFLGFGGRWLIDWGRGAEILRGGFGAAADVEFGEDVHEVGSDGAVADVQAAADFFVGKAFRDEGEDFVLAVG